MQLQLMQNADNIGSFYSVSDISVLRLEAQPTISFESSSSLIYRYPPTLKSCIIASMKDIEEVRETPSGSVEVLL